MIKSGISRGIQIKIIERKPKYTIDPYAVSTIEHVIIARVGFTLNYPPNPYEDLHM